MSAIKRASASNYNQGQIFSAGFAAGGVMVTISSITTRMVLSHPSVKQALSRPISFSVAQGLPKLAFYSVYFSTMGCSFAAMKRSEFMQTSRPIAERRWRTFN